MMRYLGEREQMVEEDRHKLTKKRKMSMQAVFWERTSMVILKQNRRESRLTELRLERNKQNSPSR